MKKTLLIINLLLFISCQTSLTSPSREAVPLDPQVRTGILPNGLTYFVMKNAKPENRASLRLVIRAGSVQETDEQRGLAHFVEHMAFNGSTNFSKNELVDYFETIGMDFGHDLNAYTSFEETVYMLEIPTDKLEITDKSLTVLDDWVRGLSFDPTEVEKERGVVQEEWRLGRNADTRRFEIQWPLMSGGSVYSERLPIGKMDIIRHAPSQVLKDFYTKWYNPSHAALVVVGDFDPALMEKNLQERFSFGSPASPQIPPLPHLPTPVSRTVQLFSDPELSYNLIQILRIRTDEDRPYGELVKEEIISHLVSSALNTRFGDLARTPNPPFIQAQWAVDSFLKGTSALTLSVVPGVNQYLGALESTLREVQKLRTAGFTLREAEREKGAFLSGLEQAYAQRFDVKSQVRAQGLVDYFLNNRAFPSDDMELETYKKALEAITSQDMSRYLGLWMADENELVLVSGPEKEDNVIPKESQVEQVIAQMRSQVFEPETTAASVVLMDKIPAAGKILKETLLDQAGVVKWELSNGAVVYVKSTDFKAEEILFYGLSRGGSSLVSDTDYLNAQLASALLSDSGVGSLSQAQLNDVLADKQINLQLSLEEAGEVLSGNSSRKDLESFFQLLHLRMSAPRKDPQAFQSVLDRISDNLVNRLQDPQQVFSDEIQRVLTGNHLRGKPLTPELLKGLSLDRMLELYKQRYSNGGDFTFFFVGDVENSQLKPLVETYLASLPFTGVESAKDLGIRPLKAPFLGEVAKGMEPRSQVVMLFPNQGLLDPDDLVAMDALKDILTLRLREAIREERGGTYGIQAGFSYRREPFGGLRYYISFGCAPERIQELAAASLVEMEKLRVGNFNPEDLSKIKEIRRRALETNLKTNNFWLNQMTAYLYTIQDPKKMMDFYDRIERLTPEVLTPLAQKYMDPKTMLQLVLTQEK